MSTPTVLSTETDSPPAWQRCQGCGAVVYGERLDRNLRVCPECGHHHRLTAHQRLAMLLDQDSLSLIDGNVTDTDPLRFVSGASYPERREQARTRTGLAEAVVCATGTVNGHPLVVAVMDFRFMGGSLGSAVGELITQAGEFALARRIPFMIVTASGGARMQEGALSLMQMAKTSQLLGQLDAAGILTISVITDPTFGGVAASYATLADVLIAEPRARLGFAGPRVIEETIKQPLPAGFQTAEFLMRHGLVDMISPRAELRARVGRLLALGSPATVTGERDAARRDSTLVTDPDRLEDCDPWQTVRCARDIARPTAADYIARVCTDFVELHGDRLAKDCPAIIGGLAMLDSTPVMAIGTQKGHTAAELSEHGFGMASPAGYRKAARLMRLAAKLGLPVVTFVDTPGAHPGLEAEEHGQAFAIAENLRLLAALPVPVVAVILGEGGSGGALALAVADRVLIFGNAVYSVISPEGCAAILWGSATAAPDAAKALRLDARHLLRAGVVDGVIPEPPGGTQSDPRAAAERLRRTLTGELAELAALSTAERTSRRHARFRRFGAVVR
ncbi:MAG: acetyl-CoA carboxylase, carboxyltransferase subunit beta [Actinocatenispora sp.]